MTKFTIPIMLSVLVQDGVPSLGNMHWYPMIVKKGDGTIHEGDIKWKCETRSETFLLDKPVYVKFEWAQIFKTTGEICSAAHEDVSRLDMKVDGEGEEGLLTIKLNPERWDKYRGFFPAVTWWIPTIEVEVDLD